MSYPSVIVNRNRKQVLLLGCSYTFGEGVREEDTFCWKMNAKQNEYFFHNYGAQARGVSATILNLQNILDNNHFDLVVYAAIANHIARECELCVTYDLEPPQVFELAKQHFYKSEELPLYLNGELHRMWLFWILHRWPLELNSRLVDFAHTVWTMQKSSEVFANADESVQNHAVNNNTKRFCFSLRSMYTLCKQRGIPLVMVDLYGFSSGSSEDRLTRFKESLKYYVTLPLTKEDVVPKIPVINAQYPVDIITRPELHAEPINGKPGSHPSPLVHSYYADRILRGLQSLNQQGKI